MVLAVWLRVQSLDLGLGLGQGLGLGLGLLVLLLLEALGVHGDAAVAVQLLSLRRHHLVVCSRAVVSGLLVLFATIPPVEYQRWINTPFIDGHEATPTLYIKKDSITHIDTHVLA